jgi:hypothetical protein
MTTTGHAARGTASPPTPAATNVWIEPGAQSPQELYADIKSGLYVTELMGMGVNGGVMWMGLGGFDGFDAALGRGWVCSVLGWGSGLLWWSGSGSAV